MSFFNNVPNIPSIHHYPVAKGEHWEAYYIHMLSQDHVLGSPIPDEEEMNVIFIGNVRISPPGAFPIYVKKTFQETVAESQVKYVSAKLQTRCISWLNAISHVFYDAEIHVDMEQVEKVQSCLRNIGNILSASPTDDDETLD